MASANIYSLENPPEFEFVVNNKGTKDIRCLNYVFRLKTAGKRSWNYLCTSHNCTASLSLKAISLEGETKLSEPFTLERLNLRHKDSCQPKLNDHFVSKKFFQQVKTEVKENPLVPIQLMNKVVLWIVVLSICVMQHAASNQEIMAAPQMTLMKIS